MNDSDETEYRIVAGEIELFFIFNQLDYSLHDQTHCEYHITYIIYIVYPILSDDMNIQRNLQKSSMTSEKYESSNDIKLEST